MEINALLPEYEAVLDPVYVKAYKANVGRYGWLDCVVGVYL